MIRLRDLHMLPNPPDDAVVCVIKGYFDNSGDAEDHQHRVVTRLIPLIQVPLYVVSEAGRA